MDVQINHPQVGARAPDGRVHLSAWILAPVTFVADLWTTTFELLVLCLVGMLLLMATA